MHFSGEKCVWGYDNNFSNIKIHNDKLSFRNRTIRLIKKLKKKSQIIIQNLKMLKVGLKIGIRKDSYSYELLNPDSGHGTGC